MLIPRADSCCLTVSSVLVAISGVLNRLSRSRRVARAALSLHLYAVCGKTRRHQERRGSQPAPPPFLCA